MVRLAVALPVVIGIVVLNIAAYAYFSTSLPAPSSDRVLADKELRATLEHTSELLKRAEQAVATASDSNQALVAKEGQQIIALTRRIAQLEELLLKQQASNVAAPQQPAPPSPMVAPAPPRAGTAIGFNALPTDTPTAVVVIACNRITVSRCLDRLLKYRPSKELFPIIVSQDCGHEQTADVISKYADVEHIKQPDLSNPPVEKQFKRFIGYAKIARHFKFALDHVFGRGFDAALIVEDDLDIAPDFYDYFLAGKRLLKQDPTLWCVSAWNDNGKRGQVQDPEQLYRSDFFPGLGWMLTKELWAELGPKWAKIFWDDWMREPQQRRERACIRPEISRTRTFGRAGVSSGQFYDKQLKFIQLNEEPVKFLDKDTSYLLKDNFDPQFEQQVYQTAELTTLIGLEDMVNAQTSKGPVRLEYADAKQFTRYAQKLGLMDDAKAGVPRGAYRGVVPLWHKGIKVFVAPKPPFGGYGH
eukprot:m.51944 g.51944  ORF g.51944 m.51944 type:complete len:472 (+) comp12257_c0_seq1:184-1599(+)